MQDAHDRAPELKTSFTVMTAAWFTHDHNQTYVRLPQGGSHRCVFLPAKRSKPAPTVSRTTKSIALRAVTLWLNKTELCYKHTTIYTILVWFRDPQTAFHDRHKPHRHDVTNHEHHYTATIQSQRHPIIHRPLCTDDCS